MAELTIAGWFLSPFIKVVINEITSAIRRNNKSYAKFETHAKSLNKYLPRILAVINAAERSPISYPALETWLKHLKDVVYDAYDALEELELKDLHEKSKGKASTSSDIVDLFFSSLKALEDEVSSFENWLIFTMDNRHDRYMYKHARETSSFLDEPVFGRDEEIQLILDVLGHINGRAGPSKMRQSIDQSGPSSSSSSSTGVPVITDRPMLSVLPIVGIAGVGKTTLAKYIFNHSAVKENFDFTSWVYVSENFQLRKILRQITDIPFGVDDSLEKILTEARRLLNGKRFFVVLDDVWNEDTDNWKILRTAFEVGSRGSMILVTTRSQLVADIMGTTEAILLGILLEDDFWSLLKYFAFHENVIGEDKLEILRDIALKLHGLPLLGKLVGYMLRLNLNNEFWSYISMRKFWELDPSVDYVMKYLILTYQHLGPNLKPCFAFCSVFPKGYIFERKKIVQMWIAQGFITLNDGRDSSLEEEGCNWFDELTRRSFFQLAWNDKYIMHDLIRELAVFISKDECSVMADESHKPSGTIRHLCIQVGNFEELVNSWNYSKLRTLLIIPNNHSRLPKWVLEKVFKQSRRLRLLDLSDNNIELESLPSKIDLLAHLRYLDVSGYHHAVTSLPKSLSNLLLLQVLNIQSSNIQDLPEGVNKLSKLMHFYGPFALVSSISDVGELVNLQELEEFRVNKKRWGRHNMKELKKLNELRRLCISNLEKVASKQDALEAEMPRKKHLKKLKLVWLDKSSNAESAGEVLEGLKPPNELTELSIENYPASVLSLHRTPDATWRVQEIYLNRCRNLSSLPLLGQLPSLRHLDLTVLDSLTCLGDDTYGHSGDIFPSLESINFNEMPGLIVWEKASQLQGRRFFPRFQRLRILACPQLIQVPISAMSSAITEIECLRSSIRNLSLSTPHALKKLTLEDCVNLRIDSTEGSQSLMNLRTLEIDRCPMVVKSLQEVAGTHGLQSLAHLSVDGQFIEDDHCVLIGRLPSLRTLSIKSCNLPYFTEEHEHWFSQLVSNLRKLELTSCWELKKLPTVLVHSNFMKELIIDRCSKIESLPESLPDSLQELHISACPLLEAQCRKEGGSEWPKIADIPYIRVNGETVQML